MAKVPLKRVFVADPLTKMPYGVLGGLSIEQAHSVLPWTVEIAQAGPKAVNAFRGDLF